MKPNQSPEPADGAVRSAVAVHAASRWWLSFLRSAAWQANEYMVRFLKRYFEVRSYFWRLPLGLACHFGKKNHYSLADVAIAAQQGGFDMAFIVSVRRESAMKLFSTILLVVSALMIAGGVGSCHRYYTMSLPSESSQPGWDGDAHWEGYGLMQAGIILLASDVAMCITGLWAAVWTLCNSGGKHWNGCFRPSWHEMPV